MSPAEARALRLVGAAIAAFSGGVLVVSLFVGWYSRSVFCELGLCPSSTTTGWSSLGAGRFLLLAAAATGVLPLAAERLPRAGRPWLRGAATLAGLAGALLVVRHAAIPPGGLGIAAGIRPLAALGIGSGLLAGPFIAFVACAGVAGGAMLTGIGHRFFDPAGRPGAATTTAILGCGAIVVATWLPWGHVRAIPVPIDAFGFVGPTRSAWSALHTLAVLLVLGALATAGAALLGLAFRWRAVFLAVAVAGWLEAAFAVAGSSYPGHAVVTAVDQGAGYYVCLGGAALAVLAGLAVAFAGPDG